MSMDCTSSSQARIFSKMSSVLILRSSITHPICSLQMFPTTGIFLTSELHTSPSRTTSFLILSQRPSKSNSSSQILTSKTTMDLAITAFFSFLPSGALASFLGLGFSSGSSSPKRSMSSYSFFGQTLASYFFSSFFSSFFSCFFSFFSSFFFSSFSFLGLKALCDSLGNSLAPTTASVQTMERYQAVILGQGFLSSSPSEERTTEMPVAKLQSAMEMASPTKNFFPLRCFSTKFKNLVISAMTDPASTSLPSLAMATAATAASKSQVVISSHWSTKPCWYWLSPPQSCLPEELAKYLMMVLEEKKVPWAVSRRGRVLKTDILVRSELASWATSSTSSLRALMTDLIFLYLELVAPSVLQCSFIQC